tara:strand:- start:222 stop:449 length:228 start_codon:yes stop_codon:yes gene_type:complete
MVKVDRETGEEQKCFVGSDGNRRCNFVFRNGKAIWTKSGKWWTFPACGSSPSAHIEAGSETATSISEMTVSNNSK